MNKKNNIHGGSGVLNQTLNREGPLELGTALEGVPGVSVQKPEAVEQGTKVTADPMSAEEALQRGRDHILIKQASAKVVEAWQIEQKKKNPGTLPENVENSPDMPAYIASILIDTHDVNPITSNGSLLKISDGHTIDTVKKVIEFAAMKQTESPFEDITRIIDPSMTDNLKYSLLWKGVSVVMTDGNPVPIKNEMYGWRPSNEIIDLDPNFKSLITADEADEDVRHDDAWEFKILKAVIDGTGEYIKHQQLKWLGKKIEPITINSSMILPIQHLLVIMGVNPVMDDGKAVVVFDEDDTYSKAEVVEWLLVLKYTPALLREKIETLIKIASTVAGKEDSESWLGPNLAYSDQSATSVLTEQSGLIARLKTPISDGGQMLSIQTTKALTELEVTLNKVIIPVNKFREEMTSEERDTVRQNIFKRFRDIDVIMPYIMSPMFTKLVTNVSPLLGDKVSSRHSSGLVANGLPAYLAKNGMTDNDMILFNVLYETLHGPLSVIESMVDTLDLTINRIIQESKPYIQVIDLIQQGLGALTSGGTRGYGPVAGSVPNIPYGLLLTTAFIGTEGMGSNALREKIKHDYKVNLKTLPTELRSETVRELYGDYVYQLDLFNKLHPETIDINRYLQNLKELLYGLAATLSKYLHNLDIINHSVNFMGHKPTDARKHAVVKTMDANYLDHLLHQDDGKTMGSLYGSIIRICVDFKANVSTNISNNTKIRMDVMSGHSDIQQTLRTPNESLSKHGGPYFGADTLLAPMLPIEYTTKSSGTTKTEGTTTETALNESVSEDAAKAKTRSYNVMNIPDKWRDNLSPKSDKLSHGYPSKQRDKLSDGYPSEQKEELSPGTVVDTLPTEPQSHPNDAAQKSKTPTSTTPADDFDVDDE